jgi:hypothetical protein
VTPRPAPRSPTQPQLTFAALRGNNVLGAYI